MPIRVYECSCGTRYETLTGKQIADTGDELCPNCKAKGKEIPARSSFKGFDNEHLMDPTERQMILNNRKMQEDLIVTGDRDDGSFSVSEKGPDWSRPFGNSEFDRKKAVDDYKAGQYQVG